jgi:predicted AAA+ superfamily ATPase
MYIKRTLEKPLRNSLFKQKVVILYGPRQAGKTTLLKHILKDHSKTKWVDCELIENNQLLQGRNTQDLFSLVKGMNIVVFDEAQTINNIGQVLKTLIDHHPEVQYIATGSSSFDLSNMISEPLTGRSLEFLLYPDFETKNKIGQYMTYGMYPGIFEISEDEKIKRLNTLTSQYLYKNVLDSGGIKKPDLVIQLLKLLAYQIGSEFSVRELSNKLGTSAITVEKYIDILEKNFIIYRLGGFGNNMRDEVTTKRKIFFIDLGIRNALIGNFEKMDQFSRNDIGHMFENFCIIERLKYISHTDTQSVQSYFWKNYTKKELDYIEVKSDIIESFECKWDERKIPKFPPKDFSEKYPSSTYLRISPSNVYSFVTKE